MTTGMKSQNIGCEFGYPSKPRTTKRQDINCRYISSTELESKFGFFSDDMLYDFPLFFHFKIFTGNNFCVTTFTRPK